MFTGQLCVIPNRTSGMSMSSSGWWHGTKGALSSRMERESVPTREAGSKMQRIPWQPPDPPADVAIVEDNEGIVVRVGVSINAINAARIRAAILAAWEKRGNPGRLVLDLGKVNHIDSSGVRSEER